MSWKFLHTSDWHFGAGRRFSKQTQNPLGYLERHEWNIRQTLKLAKDEKVEFACIVGDLFEGPSTTLDEFIRLVEVLRDFGKICPVYVSAGNHDEEKVGTFQLRHLKDIKIPGVHVSSSAKSYETGKNRILLLPWTGIKSQKDFEDTIHENYNGEEVIGLHECFSGAVADGGYRAKGGISVPVIDGVRYYALGDIHKTQKLREDAWYCGAPLQFKFGDIESKGAIVVEVKSEFEYIPTFHPLKNNIQLKQVHTLSDIPENSPDWHQLRIKANEIPSYLPPSVKDLDILPATLDIAKELSKEGQEDKKISIDYTLGVPKLLQEAGYSEVEISTTLEEIKGVTKSVY